MPTATSRLKVKIDGDNRSAKRAIQETKNLSEEFAKSVKSNFQSGIFTLFGFEKLLTSLNEISVKHKEILDLVQKTGKAYQEVFRAERIAREEGIDPLEVLGAPSEEVTKEAERIRVERARRRLAAGEGDDETQRLVQRLFGSTLGEFANKLSQTLLTGIARDIQTLDFLVGGRIGGAVAQPSAREQAARIDIRQAELNVLRQIEMNTKRTSDALEFE